MFVHVSIFYMHIHREIERESPKKDTDLAAMRCDAHPSANQHPYTYTNKLKGEVRIGICITFDEEGQEIQAFIMRHGLGNIEAFVFTMNTTQSVKVVISKPMSHNRYLILIMSHGFGDSKTYLLFHERTTFRGCLELRIHISQQIPRIYYKTWVPVFKHLIFVRCFVTPP